MKNKLLSLSSAFLVLVTSISIAVVAQKPKPAEIEPSVERLQQYIAYLASDALEGRRTGSPGANDAAHYIAGEFARLGLRPAGQNTRTPRNRAEAAARFKQPFPYVAGVELGKSNLMSLPSSGQTLKVGEDWMPLGLSANGRVDNTAAVFVGYGITAAELNYNDYSGLDIAGKVAIALQGTTDGNNPHGQFARYEDVRFKAIAARTAGAKALVLVSSEDSFQNDRLSRLRYDNTAGDAGIPVVVISRQITQRLMPASSFSDLETTARTSRSPETKRPEVAVPISIVTDVVRREVSANNIVGILEGSDSTLKNEYIVIGAHYDHLGRGGSGSLATREGEIHHGADDNASGVAGVLELARVLAAQRTKLRRSIVFIAFSGEEEGLLGSNFYVNHPTVPLANTIAMINLDMIGRLKNRNLIVGGVGTAQEWRSLLEGANVAQSLTVTVGANETASSNKVPLVVGANGRTIISGDAAKQFQLTLSEDGFGPSDHSSFYGKQIPVLFFWTGTHEDYHKPSDTADKINYIDEARIVSFVARVVRDVDSGKRPTYAVAKSESTGRSTGFRVYLGTIPNYADSGDGLLLDGVRDDSPAAKAGIRAGDRIVKLAGKDVRNVYDYTYVLGEMKAGEEYQVEIMRGTERLTLKLTPALRK